MNRFLPSAVVIATGLVLGDPAPAAKLCKLTGNYKETNGPATVAIKGKSGRLTAPDFCSTPYTFKITDLTTTGFTVTGKNKTKSCGTFTTMPMFEGSCSEFSGTVTIRNRTSSYSFTKQATPAPPAVIDASKMTDGLQ